MKKEFMLLIRNHADAKKMLSAEEHLSFVKKCEVHIGELLKNGNLIGAQPLMREGVMISKNGNEWDIINIDGNKEVQVGYYHLLANDIDEVISIAKNNPEFEYVPSASIEVRPIKMMEVKTGFVYPNEK